MIAITLFEKLIYQTLVLWILFSIGFEDSSELFSWYFTIFVEVKVSECILEVLAIVWGWFREAGWYKLIVG